MWLECYECKHNRCWTPVSTDPNLWQPSVISGQSLRIYFTEKYRKQTLRWDCPFKQPQSSSLPNKAFLITLVTTEYKLNLSWPEFFVCACVHRTWLGQGRYWAILGGPVEEKTLHCQISSKTNPWFHGTVPVWGEQPNTHTFTHSFTNF